METSPSDLISELQGRLPVQVHLNKLELQDIKSILVTPEFSIIKQYQSLMETDKVNLTFEKDGLSAIAESAYNANENLENIGARRLNNIMESLLRNILFDAPYKGKKTIVIDRKYVENRLKHLNIKDNWKDWVI